MTLLTAAGWFVIHTLWLGSLVAGAAALVIALVGDRRVRARCVAAYAGLMLTAAAPLVVMAVGDDLLSDHSRRTLLTTMANGVPLPQLLDWRTTLLPIVGGVWLLWCGLSVWRVVGEWRRAARLLRGPHHDVTDAIESEVQALRRVLSIHTPVRVRQTIAADVPMVLGFRAATILLPPAAVAAMSADERRAILCHELAHVQRRDLPLNLVQIAVETVLCHHPAAAWLSARVRADREYCCDDIAVRTTDDPRAYAHALVGLDDARSDVERKAARSDNRLLVAASSGTLLHRVSRIAGRPPREVPLLRVIVGCAAATLVAAAVFAFALALPPHLPPGTKMRSAAAPPPNAADLSGGMLPKRSVR